MRARAAAGLVAAIVVASGVAWGEPPPSPLEIRLDLARAVVVGEVVKVNVQSKDERGWTYGTTTISVKETLKADPAGPIETATGNGPCLAHDVGRRRIWFIWPDRHFSTWGSGSVGEDQKDEVLEILKVLESRTWSVAVNGIETWAGVLRPEKRKVVTPSEFTLLFVARNSTRGDLFLPRANCRDRVLTAHMKRDDGKEFAFPLRNDGAPCPVLHCDKVAAGGSDYIGEWSVPFKGDKAPEPGRYVVTLTYRNDEDGVLLTAVGMPEPAVKTWKGEVSPPSFEVVVP